MHKKNNILPVYAYISDIIQALINWLNYITFQIQIAD